MKREELITLGKRALIVLVALIVFQVGTFLIRSIKKAEDVVISVNTIKLVKQKTAHIMTVQGIVEGDPQVKVYPQVAGKFSRNNVTEGQLVNKGNIIAYIDRDIIGATFELAPVKAPISGMVTKLYYIDKGDSVNPQMPMAEIANEEKIKVVFNLGQDELLKIKKDQRAVISYVNDAAISMEGLVVSVPPVVDKDIMAGTIVVKADNKGKTMKIGMSVNVDITYDDSMAFMVPEKAVLLGENYSYVYINRAGKAESVKVNLDYRTNNLIEIMGPLTENDELITEGNFKLYDGIKVSTAGPAEKKKSFFDMFKKPAKSLKDEI